MQQIIQLLFMTGFKYYQIGLLQFKNLISLFIFLILSITEICNAVSIKFQSSC